ncbi:MAG: HAD-IB family phosphatase [Erysipelotrichaceae bacterium]|nr:HAD-IB family phosphatase [Erysipelotrichaceae bacterium]
MDTVFLFDLDSTVTSKEILPYLAESIGIGRELSEMTEKTMRGEIPFRESFTERVKLLSVIPVSEADRLISGIPLNEKLAGFIRDQSDRCFIITGNLDKWIYSLIERIGLPWDHCFCSEAETEGDRLTGIRQILDKVAVTTTFESYRVAVGDGDNDIGMIKTAETGIAFGGVRELSMEMVKAADIICMNEDELLVKLNEFLNEI